MKKGEVGNKYKINMLISYTNSYANPVWVMTG